MVVLSTFVTLARAVHAVALLVNLTKNARMAPF